MLTEDTIAAPATAPGEAGVAIIRLSGPEALPILRRVFAPVSTLPGAHSFPDRKLVYGTVVDPGDPTGAPVDESLAVVMRGPRSFTGEDVAEIHCHGGSAVVSAVLDLLLAAGARLAEPGEFSRRAFLNGRMDLSQVEALSDLICARTQSARRMAMRQLRGGLSERMGELRAQLINAAAHLEAHLDFPDEDVPAPAREAIAGAMSEVARGVCSLLETFRSARLVREGARVVLAGLPNAGKSSVFNALLNRERAIVSPHPGTTRDTIEATVDLNGVPVTLVDTAGLREAFDEVERIGIERSAEEVRGADLILHVVDSTAADLSAEVSELHRLLERGQSADVPVLLVLNKSDLMPTRRPAPGGSLAGGVLVSASSRTGLDQLENAISDKLLGASSRVEELQITRARHAECLRAAHEALEGARTAFAGGLSGEFVMIDLREAIVHLGEIMGERLDEQILDRIFSTFCLGK